ncbi:adhesion G protein-coupled receptor E1-like [Eleutherodactylus coqui]|uniref:adhesion G protein-coupled receptor E1-like n=1 Tax=Eleutherodactylus coqui TaxID=57060 RepID=UPI00346320E0
MQTSGRLLLCGLCLFLSCCTVRGLRYLPPEAAHFPKCIPSRYECPANSACEETTKGYYCACKHRFISVKGKTTITYPGGECLELCSAGESASPCACRRGFALLRNANGLYQCRDTCRSNSDCPSEATCTSGRCYCKVCRPEGNNCITLVKLDDVCPDPVPTTTPLLTTVMRFPTTRAKPRTVAPQPGEILTLPSEAINFPRCDPAMNECPANSVCLQTNKGYHCACNRNFLNDIENTTITYPGGQCLEFCSAKENIYPCACRGGLVLRVNGIGRYVCAEAPVTTTSPLLTTPTQPATGTPRTGGHFIKIVNSR